MSSSSRSTSPALWTSGSSYSYSVSHRTSSESADEEPLFFRTPSPGEGPSNTTPLGGELKRKRRGNVDNEVFQLNTDDDEQPVASTSASLHTFDPTHDATSSTSSRTLDTQPPNPPAPPDLLSEYPCPICFFPPTNATFMPCGHICCGSCLFTAVKTTMQRAAHSPEPNIARCPVCRAPIVGWDGKGGGVIGLKVRAVFSL